MSMKFRFNLPASLIVAMMVLGAACKRVNAPKPNQNGFQEDIPVETSYINVPLSFSFDEMEKRINHLLKDGIFKSEPLEDAKTSILVERSDEIQISKDLDAQELVFKVPIHVVVAKVNPPKVLGIELPERNKSSDIDFEAVVWLKTPVSITEDWQIESNCRIEEIEWVKKPKVSVGPVKIGIKRRVEKMLMGEDAMVTNLIDSSITNQVMLKPSVAKLWHQLHHPILINRRFKELWLCPKPKMVWTTPLYLTEYEITSNVMCAFDLKAVTSAPDTSHLTQLPNWKTKVDSSTGYQLKVKCELGYEEMGEAFTLALKDAPLEFASNNINVKQVRVLGNGPNVNLQLLVEGDMSGEIFMQGKPVLDTIENALKFDDIEFDIKTEETLVKMANWLLHSEFKRKIQQKARLEISEFAQLKPELLEKAVENSKAGVNMKLHASTMLLTAEKIAVTEKGIQIMACAKGKIKVEVKKQKRPDTIGPS